MKHTPGPWYTKISTPKEESKKYGGGNCGANALVLAKTGKRIWGIETSDVIVFLPHWREDAENERHIANAKLIAAAPDLLKALQDAYLEIQTLVQIEINNNCFSLALKTDSLRASLRNKISLATGENCEEVQKRIEAEAIKKATT